MGDNAPAATVGFSKIVIPFKDVTTRKILEQQRPQIAHVDTSLPIFDPESKAITPMAWLSFVEMARKSAGKNKAF